MAPPDALFQKASEKGAQAVLSILEEGA